MPNTRRPGGTHLRRYQRHILNRRGKRGGRERREQGAPPITWLISSRKAFSRRTRSVSGKSMGVLQADELGFATNDFRQLEAKQAVARAEARLIADRIVFLATLEVAALGFEVVGED